MIEFSDEVLHKAHKLLDLVKVQEDPAHLNIWWVESSAGDRQYRVQSDFDQSTGHLSWVTCTCPHGLNKGAGEARCYHVAAVLLILRTRGADQ